MVDRVPAFILVSLLLISSCDSKKQNAEVKSAAATTPSPPSANPTPAAPPPPTPPASITLEQMGLVHQGLPLNKLNDPAWESESLNDAAGRQLSALGKLLTEPGKLSEAAVAPFLAPDFRSSSLRPENLETVFADGDLLVRRAPGTAQPSPTTAAVFVQSMQKLFADYPEAAEVHVKFKVFRVTLDRPLAETTVRVELVAEGKTASLQQTAEWRCQWQRRDGEEPLLASVVVDSFEETRAGEGGPRFVDRNGSCAVEGCGLPRSACSRPRPLGGADRATIRLRPVRLGRVCHGRREWRRARGPLCLPARRTAQSPVPSKCRRHAH